MKSSKKIVAAICAAVCACMAFPFSAIAAESTPVSLNLLALGDETLLSVEGEATAVDLLADYYHGTAVNDAVAGTTSTALVQSLQSDAAIQADVAEADIIVISVGYQDIMDNVFYDNPYYTDASSYTTFFELMQNASTSNALNMIQAVVDVLPEMVETLNENITLAVSLLQEQNTSAEIVVQGVQNPMAVDMDLLKTQGLSDNRVIAVQELRNFLHVCMQGGSYTSSYYPAASVEITTGINQTIASLSGVSVVDFYDAFYGASGETSLGFDLTYLENLNMSYKPIGQVVLAAEIANTSDLLRCGDGTVLAEAYTATGVDLSSTRSALHLAIQTASSTEYAARILGDIDADGSVTIQDASLALTEYANAAAGNGSSFHILERKAADAQADGEITILDASLILRYYANLAAGVDITWEELA